MQATMRARRQRVIRLRCLTDDNIYDHVEGGLNQDGSPTQSRLRLERALVKRLPVLGSDPQDGDQLPVFVLAEQPKEIFHPNDPFDRDHLKDNDGRWALPTQRWREEQAKRIKKRGDSARLAEQKAKQMAATTVVDNLARLVSAPAAVPEVPPSAEQKAEPEKKAAK